MLSSCQILQSSLESKRDNHLSHCTRVLSCSGHKHKLNKLNLRHCTLTCVGHKDKLNKLSHCTRWPVCKTTHCGSITRIELSHCTLTVCGHKRRETCPINNTVYLNIVNSLCSTQDRDQASTNGKCIICLVQTDLGTDKIEAVKRTEKPRRKRDREPSRIPFKRILKLSKKKNVKNEGKIFIKTVFSKLMIYQQLCRNYKSWYLRYTTPNFYNKYVFFMNIQK